MHLDGGGGAWSGHMLHLPPGRDSAIHLYDVRRLGRGARHREPDGAGSGGRTGDASVLPGAPPSLPLVARIGTSRAGHSLASGAFAADAGIGLLVGGGGSGKAACSYRWPLRAAGADAQRSTPGEALSVADDDDESLESQRQQEKAAAKERAAKKKKQRIVTSGGGFKAKQGSSNRMG